MAWAGTLQQGLSPRARGNRVGSYQDQRAHRSIPACTGEPTRRSGWWTGTWVYPRVHGGTGIAAGVGARLAGLSPRARGNLWWKGETVTIERSIPACTGEPMWETRPLRTIRVYPRVHGGTDVLPLLREPWDGLSPRARGNPSSRQWTLTSTRSIPACTGEPPGDHRRGAGHQVYPRVHGGTSSTRMRAFNFAGLSPRARGNHPR